MSDEALKRLKLAACHYGARLGLGQASPTVARDVRFPAVVTMAEAELRAAAVEYFNQIAGAKVQNGA